MSQFFIGVDGGGSATRAVVMNEDREILGRGESGASNHYSVGVAAAARNCNAAANYAIENAHQMHPDFAPNQIRSWGFGLAGVRREADASRMREALNSVCPLPFALETDVVAAHAGAFAGSPGIVVSAGTGAIIFGADEFGARVYADGWGPLLGDEGGGYWIGVEAMRAACRSIDGRAHLSALTQPVLHQMGVANGDELVRFVHSEACTRGHVASLASLVFMMADEGVVEAVDIRARAAQLLSRGIRAVGRGLLNERRERMTTGEEIAPLDMLISLRGGVFEDDFMRATVGFSATEAMVELKRDFLPIASWRVVKPQYDAAVGAALLGQLIL